MINQNKIIRTSEIYPLINRMPKHFEFYRGGRGSTKSHTIVQKLLTDFCNEKRCNYLFTVKETSSVQSSVIPSIESIIEDLDIKEKLKVTRNNIKNKYGKRIFVRGFDKPEKAKNLSKIGITFIDELNHFTYEDFKMISNSTREIDDWKVIVAFNPVSETIWIKTLIYDVEEWRNKINDIKTICENNVFLAESKKDEYRSLKDIDEVSYQVDYLGNWGTLTSQLVFGSKIRVINEIPEGAKFVCYGLDFSYGGDDPHALVETYIYNKELYIKSVYYGNLPVYDPINRNDLASFIIKNCHQLKKVQKNGNTGFIVCDIQNDYISMLRKCGIPAYKAKKGPDSILEGLNKMKLFHRINLLDNLPKKPMVSEYRNYKYKKNKTTGLIEPIVMINQPDHSIDAGRYSIDFVNV